VHILYSGTLYGYLEPCGCKEGRVGGVARLAAAAQDSLQRWRGNALLLDAGDFAEVYTLGDSLKNLIVLQAFAMMGYHAVNVTAQDLILGRETLIWARDSLKLPLVSANLVDKNSGGRFLPEWRQIRIKQQVFGILGVGAVRPLEMRRSRESTLEFADPETAVRQTVMKMKPQCDRIILLTDLPARCSRQIAIQNPEIDLVLSTMELEPQTNLPRFGKALTAGTSRKGRALTTIGLSSGPQDTVTAYYTRTLLDSTFKDDPAVSRLLSDYHNMSEKTR
jgi:2',3'-cyclic-nucleotide 2'-phosphodiesterase (5'-nucleotidase family)